MVTLLDPLKRVVSIWAWMAVDWPGASSAWKALAVTQPHETRMLAMWTVEPVLLVMRNRCVSVGPRGTEPKSLLRSSNRPSAHEAADAGVAAKRPTRTTRRKRNMVMGPFP